MPSFKPAHPPTHFPHVLFEDNHVIAVNKPAGMLSQADGSVAKDVLTEIKEFIKRRDNKPGNVFVGLVHRLDRPVGGAMVLAKTSKAASRLSKAFRERAVQKIYRAIIEGDVSKMAAPNKNTLSHHLLRDERTRVTHVVTDNGKPAKLNWQPLGAQSHQSVVEIELITGLPHQIRAQFSHLGHPIVGDKKYGAKQILLNHKGVIALYCHQLILPHPTQNEPITISAPPPSHWPIL